MAIISSVFDPEKWTSEGVTAFATAIIALFTCVLVFVTDRQARLTKRSVRIAERTLTDLERPILYVLDFFYSINNPLSDDHKGQTINYRIANYGRTPATIYEFCEQFYSGNELPIEPKYRNKRAVQIVVPPGDAIRMPTAKAHLGRVEYEDGRSIEKDVPFYFGYLKYRDILGFSYTTGFGFMPDGSRIASPKYNYEAQRQN
jgi:hypothetical protein